MQTSSPHPEDRPDPANGVRTHKPHTCRRVQMQPGQPKPGLTATLAIRRVTAAHVATLGARRTKRAAAVGEADCLYVDMRVQEGPK